MNMISTGAFLDEMDASSKQPTVAEKFAAVWEKKNAKAARAGGVSLMALSLAACGSSSDDTPAAEEPAAPTTPVTPAAPEPTSTALTVDTDTIAAADTGDTLTGTVGTTASSTLEAADVIAMGAGDDTLEVTMTSNFGGSTGTIDMGAGSDTISITNGSTNARTFDATGVSNVETVKVDMNSESFTYSDAAATGLSVDVSNSASDTLTVAYASADVTKEATDELSVTMNDVTGLNLVSTGIETLNITSNGSTLNSGDLSAGNSTKVVVDGSNAITVTAVDAGVKTYDGSAATGVQKVTLTAASPTTVKGGSADDVITVKDMGSRTATIDGGAGADELVMSGTSGVVSQHTISGVETITFKGLLNSAMTMDMTNVSDVSTFQIKDGLNQAVTIAGGEGVGLTVTDTKGTTASGTAAFTSTSTSDFALDINTNNAAMTMGSAISASKADDVDVTIGKGVTVSGTQTYAKAEDLDVTTAGSITGAITAATAQTVDLTATGTTGKLNGTTYTFAKAETVNFTSANSSDTVTAVDVRAVLATDLTFDVAGNLGFAATADFSKAANITLKTSGTVDLGSATAVDVGDASASLTIDATGVIKAATIATDNYATGKGTVVVKGSDLSNNTITIGTGRTNITVEGGIGVNAISLGDIAAPGATTPVTVSITTNGIADSDSVAFASGESLTGDYATVTLSGVDTITSNGGSLALDASAVSGQTLTMGAAGVAGDITLAGTSGADTINLANVSEVGSGSLTVNGAAGADTITGTSGVDIINGGAGVDTITGGSGADVITGGAGADLLTGGAGNDIFTLTESGDFGDTIDIDGSGTDTIKISVNVNSIGTATATASVVATKGTTVKATATATATGSVTGLFSAAFQFATKTGTTKGVAGSTSKTTTVTAAAAVHLNIVKGNATATKASTIATLNFTKTAGTAALTNRMVLDNNGSGFASLAALKSKLAFSDSTMTASEVFVAFGLLTNGKLYQFTLTNGGSGTAITTGEIGATNLVATLTDYTNYAASDIVLI
jgi:hypothetical protein